MRYRDGEISKEQLKAIVTEFCDRRVDAIGNILSIDFNAYTGTLINELKSNLFRKLSRMRVLELSKNALPEKDIHENIEAAIKSALYMTYRYMYNNVPKMIYCIVRSSSLFETMPIVECSVIAPRVISTYPMAVLPIIPNNCLKTIILFLA